MFFLKLLYAVFGVAMGLGMLKYRKTVYDWTGKIYWAEKYLGSGGTVVVICLIALGLIAVSVAYPFGTFDKAPQTNSMNAVQTTSDTNTVTNQ